MAKPKSVRSTLCCCVVEIGIANPGRYSGARLSLALYNQARAISHNTYKLLNFVIFVIFLLTKKFRGVHYGFLLIWCNF